MPVRSQQARRDVHALRPVFNTVELDAYRQGAPAVQYTRLNSHYRPAVELARLIIDNSSLELLHGQTTGASFMLDMNRVFEQFLVVALREALRLSERQWGRGHLTLDEGDNIRLEPDLSWRSGGRYGFVGDAKYKRIKPDGFPNADIYQMLAYCVAAELPSGLLIYAADELERTEPRRYQIRNAGKNIEVASIDLEGQPDDILKEVSRLADRVKAHYCGLLPSLT